MIIRVSKGGSMSPLDKNTGHDASMVHVALPCPACGEPVSVVADVVNERSRWCCTSCLTLGTVPWAIITQAPPANVPRA
jgi:hypothetical protein